MVLAGPAGSGSEFVNLERLSDRVVLAYWVGLDRRCNLTAIRSRKGLVIIDTEMSPRIMTPIKERLELVFGRSDWVYVINTHAHDNHPGGNSLFKSAVIVGNENLAQQLVLVVAWNGGDDRRVHALHADRLGIDALLEFWVQRGVKVTSNF